MADTQISEIPIVVQKKSRSRKPLKPKTTSSASNEANILAGGTIITSSQPPLAENSSEKENHESLSNSQSAKKAAKAAKKQSKKQPSLAENSAENENHESLPNSQSAKKAAKAAKKQSKKQPSFEKELQEMQEKLEQLKIEKEKTDEMLKEKDEMLKEREGELETRCREQEKLQIELKKLQKIKEFKPTMSFPIVQSLKDKEQDKKDKKKRPSTPYILWCKNQWSEVKKENPNAEFKEISNILGTKWKTVTAEEKRPYEEKYQADKEAYLKIAGNEKRENEAMNLLMEEQKQKTAMELLDQYLQFKEEAEKEDTKKTKKEKDPLKPKQPMSAFFLFASQRRVTLFAENKNFVEVAKITGEEWKNMTEELRGPYEEMAKKSKEKYVQEMEAYKQNKEEEAEGHKREDEEFMKVLKLEALQLLKKKEKADNIIKKTKEEGRQKKKKEEKNVDPHKPKRPASSFILFSKEARKNLHEERPEINNSTLNALISVKWKELSEQEKHLWNEKAGEAMEAYKKELEVYNKTAAATIHINLEQ